MTQAIRILIPILGTQGMHNYTYLRAGSVYNGTLKMSDITLYQ